jgi:membrane-associated phospholipid phosphatase
VLTYAAVTSGFDWQYYEWTRGPTLMEFMFPSALIGFFVPILLPLSLYMYGATKKNEDMKRRALAVAQAALAGLLLSFFYKALTGRAHPELLTSALVDITHNFQFGFLRVGVFWGWPSSHTTTAFSVAAATYILFEKYPLLRYSMLVYALYIGIGVSMTIDWFSDFAAGAIFGTLIGILVAKNFLDTAPGSSRST